MPSLFTKPAAFRAHFVQGLAQLARGEAIGTYILALANASFERELLAELATPLRAGFDRLQPNPGDNPADVEVFSRIQANGFENLEEVSHRSLPPWEIQFNPMRALRPPRNAGQEVTDTQKPFDPNGFHFNKPFLRAETIWRGELLGQPVDLLYNKFPFVPLHGLLVPDREAQQPQWLTRDGHHDIWRLAQALPEWGFGYNALGANASVNHLHFQSFLRATPLPVELPRWRHNQGDEDYPLACQVFTDCDESFAVLDAWQRQPRAFNLLYRAGKLYAMPRRFQGSHPHSPWTGGYAWYEACGGVVTFRREDFTGLRAEDCHAELARMRVETV